MTTASIITGYTLQWKSSRYDAADKYRPVDTTEWPADDASSG